MKKIILLLTICLAYVYAHAQTFDKKLLLGKWMLYSMSGDGHTISKDSMEQNIVLKIKHIRIQNPERQMTMNDSLKLASNIRNRYADLFKTYTIYHEDGSYIVFSGVDRDENGNLSEKVGTYVWSGDDKILQTVANLNPEAYIVVSLSADKLVLSSDNKEEQKKNLRMVFVR